MDVNGWATRGRRRLGVAALIALTAATALTASTARATTTRSEFFGIAQGPTLDARDLQSLARAHVHTDRFMLNWGWVQPRSGSSFNWAGPDRLIGALAAHGIRAVPTFWGNPGWVYGSPAHPPLQRPRDVQAWKVLLRAAVARYGPGGVYWSTRYRQQYGSSASPLPITAWQIWNEPNLRKYFAPYPSPTEYARLVQISHDAIKGKDPNAQVVLAGMPGHGDVEAWSFLRSIYSVPGARTYFDAVALHPYARDLDHFRQAIVKMRTVMRGHGDAGTPLWISEIAWGSAPPDGRGINKGPAGQAQMLRASYRMVLEHRAAWNVQRMFWYHWRDPRRSQASCSFCGSAGLENFNRTRKPVYSEFARFATDTTPPNASITSGPLAGGTTADPTPTFRFSSSEAGSTFQCRFGAQVFARCASPFTPSSRLFDGRHQFSVRAVDAAGNVSAMLSRSFTVDTSAPTVTITSGPATGSVSANTRPSFGFSASESGVTYQCQLDGAGFSPCSSPQRTPPLANGQHRFTVVATDGAGNASPPASRTWTVDSTAPAIRLSSGPTDGSTSADPTPTFRFASSKPGSHFVCRLDSRGFSPCSSPHALGPLRDGAHVFGVRTVDPAGNTSNTLEVDFTVDTVAPRLAVDGAIRVMTRKSTASATFTLTASEQADLGCRISSRRFAPCSQRYRTPKLTTGPHTLKVKATDPAGNVTSRRKRFWVVERGGKRARSRAAWRQRMWRAEPPWRAPAQGG
jgi:Big-like domain-containing protein/putative glycosyl hydrolase